VLATVEHLIATYRIHPTDPDRASIAAGFLAAVYRVRDLLTLSQEADALEVVESAAHLAEKLSMAAHSESVDRILQLATLCESIATESEDRFLAGKTREFKRARCSVASGSGRCRR